MTTITPFLWFDNDLEEALTLYGSLFPGTTVLSENRHPDGSLFFATFEVAGQRLYGMNGGPGHPQTDAFSLFVSVTTQDEVDKYWDALTADGGEESMCGWLKDRFGVSWQIVPKALMDYQADPDREKSGRVVQAMLTMRKIVIADLDAAAAAG